MYSCVTNMLSLRLKNACIQGLCQGDIDSTAEHLKFYFDVLFPKKAQVPLGMENGRYAFTCLVSSTIVVTILWSYLVSPMANRIGLKVSSGEVSSGEDPDTATIIKLSLVPPNRNQRLSLTALLSHIKFMQTRARETISSLLVSGLLRCFMVSRLSSP